MVKTAQSVAHRLKEDETSDESAKESKPAERNHIGVQDVGVKVGFSQRKYGNKSVPFMQCLFHSSLVKYKKQTLNCFCTGDRSPVSQWCSIGHRDSGILQHVRTKSIYN